MENCYINIREARMRNIDGEVYISCWNFSNALNIKEREISDLCKEIDNLEQQISELEYKLNVSEQVVEEIQSLLLDKQRKKLNEQSKYISNFTSELLEKEPECAINKQFVKITGLNEKEIEDILTKKICFTNPNCEKDPSECGYSINCSSFDEYKACGPTHFLGGLECPYSFKKLNVVEIGNTDEPIETSEFPVYKPNCNLTNCRYNANGK